MITQAFLYNAIFFTYALVLTNFYHVSGTTGWYSFPFAFGNLVGPLTIGHLFDTIGRQADDLRHLHRVGACSRSPHGCSTRVCSPR